MNKLLSIFKSKASQTGSSLPGSGISPQNDWKTIFIVTVIASVLVSALNVYMYMEVERGDAFIIDSPVEESANTLDLEKLRSTLRYYQSKAAEFEIIKSGTTSPIVDPSL